jgi:tetratricopeptide (TPR) repeat protein
MSNDSKTPPTSPENSAPDSMEGPGKGKAFFDRAKTVADTGNFDYAIDMYIEGLKREPFNVDQYKALAEVAFRRKASGKKAGGGFLGAFGGGPKLPFKGKSPKEGLLNNAFLLAHDWGNITAMLALIRNAVLLDLRDVVLWLGPILKEANRTTKSPKVEIYIELGEIYAQLEEFERACDVINEASALKPQDNDLPGLAQQYATQATLKKGNYEKGESFKNSIKDVELTKQLLQDESLAKSQEYLTKMLAQTKADYEANPKELQVISKYSKALQDWDDEEHENQAIEVLRKAFVETKTYRLKAEVGTIKMKQFRRNLRMLRDAVKADPNDKDMLHEFQRVNKERLHFETEEYKERVDNMPTDFLMKYELGIRYWEAKNFDAAIPLFQEAANNPKVRTDALHFLGRSFLHQGMKPEAVETAKRSIESYELAESGDKRAKELYYWYARALEENKKIADAIVIYSKVVQWEISFLDARKRLTDLRAQQEQQGSNSNSS